jgi:hypothetical protein
MRIQCPRFLNRCNGYGLFLLLLLTVLSIPGFSIDTISVSKSGRRIQLDGFLLDWVQKGQRVWKGSNGWVWDAVNTPEGLAGYFHCGMVACSSWTFYADLHHLKTRPWEMRLADSSQSGDHNFVAVRSARNNRFTITFEWVIPWDSLSMDASGGYALNIAGESGCGDTLEPFLLKGQKEMPESFLPSRFKERVALIVVLLVVFIALQFATRKKTRRKGSLGR